MTDKRVFDITGKTPSVFYTVRLEQGPNGLRSVKVEDVSDDERSRESIAVALRDAADIIAPSSVCTPSTDVATIPAVPTIAHLEIITGRQWDCCGRGMQDDARNSYAKLYDLCTRAADIAAIAQPVNTPSAASITACAVMIHMICETRPKKEWTENIEKRIRWMLLKDSSIPTVIDAAPKLEHADDVEVDMFAAALKEKLAQSRAKGRYGWQTASPTMLSAFLREHVEKGDPRDVANFCLFLWHHGAAIEPASAVQDAAGEPFQSRVQPWMRECFGAEIAADRYERNHRFFEEAGELVQACGMTASEARQLVDYTWGRPVGEKGQETGGVMVTLAALCLANGLDMHAAGETELARISQPDVVIRIRAKQASKPKHSPLPAAAQPADYRFVHVGKIISKFGDPEAFGEREVVVDAEAVSKVPYGAKLFVQIPVASSTTPDGEGEAQ